jgi:hypothetical protein
MSLLDSTQKLLRESQKDGWKLREIALLSDGEVEREWLYRFARGEIPNPGVKNIQSLHDCLKKLKSKSAA